MITCGHCSTFGHKVRHASVDEVRACAARRAGKRASSTYAAAQPARGTFPNGRPHLHTPTPIAWPSRQARTPLASANRPAPRPTRTPLPSIPAGQYGIPTSQGTLLINVDRPVGGRWDGYTFLNMINPDGSQGDAIRDRDTRERYIRAIAANVVEAGAWYGRATKRCTECHRQLRKPESKRAGIGPVCATRLAARARIAAQRTARI